jgi:hypothetical protein
LRREFRASGDNFGRKGFGRRLRHRFHSSFGGGLLCRDRNLWVSVFVRGHLVYFSVGRCETLGLAASGDDFHCHPRIQCR